MPRVNGQKFCCLVAPASLPTIPARRVTPTGSPTGAYARYSVCCAIPHHSELTNHLHNLCCTFSADGIGPRGVSPSKFPKFPTGGGTLRRGIIHSRIVSHAHGEHWIVWYVCIPDACVHTDRKAPSYEQDVFHVFSTLTLCMNQEKQR